MKQPRRKTERRRRAHWLRTASCLLPWLLCAQAAAEERAPASCIPQSVIEEISGLAVPYKARIADGEKRRKHKTVLREGARIHAEYPAATNLYVLLGKMLDAAQGLAMLDGEEEMRRQMLDLAARLSAAEAPAAARLAADALLTHARLARAGGDAGGAGAAIASFAEKYLNTAAEAQNLMQGMLMAWDADQRPLFEAFRRRLAEDLWDEPGVAAFLHGRFAITCGAGHLFDARLTCLDGRVLRLPMDVLGHYVLVNFWSGSIKDIEYKLALLKQFRREHMDDVFVLGVNLDESRFEVERFVRRYGLEWIHAFSGMGAQDPAFLRYGMPHLPSYCLIDPRGRIVAEDAHGQVTGKLQRGQRPFQADSRLPRKMVFLKSGEFLVTAPIGSTDPDSPPETAFGTAKKPGRAETRVPRSVLDGIQERFTTPPLRYALREAESIERYETVLRLGEETVARYPQAANLWVARNRMIVAAQGLAALKLDDAFQRHAERIAQEVLRSEAPPEARLIADACAARAALRQLDREEEEKTDKILRDLLARYDHPGVEAVGLAAAALLAMEAGREKVHREWLNLLALRHEEDPRVRQVLMTFEARRDMGRPFKARLTRLDGGVLNLPDDLLGKVVFVYFLDLPEEADDRKEALEFLRGLKDYRRRYAEGVEIVGISLDTSREALERLRQEEGWPWPVAFSGKGLEDPTAQFYGVQQPCRFPHVYIVGQDGVVLGDLPPEPGETPAAAVGRVTQRVTETFLRVDRETAAAALAAGNFLDAERLLDRIIETCHRGHFAFGWWGHHVYRQRAEARVAQGKWASALDDMGSAITSAQCKAQNALRCDPLYEYRAELLEKLGRADEAQRDREAAQQVRLDAGKRRDWLERHGGGRREAEDSFRWRAVPAWKICGPFPLDSRSLGRLAPYRRLVRADDIPIPEFWREFLPPEQGIDFSAVYAGKDGAKAGWRTVEPNEGDWRSEGVVNLSALYPEIDFAVACAAAYVFSAQAGTYTVGAGCDDLMTVRVNGKEICAFYGPGQASRGQKTLQLDLDAGWNEIVLKTANFTHEWGFCFDVIDSEESLRFALCPRERFDRAPSGAEKGRARR